MKLNHYYEKLFGTNLYWFRGSRKQYEQLVKDEFKLRAVEIKTSKGTFEVYKKNNIWVGVIWLSNRNFEVLVHECFHAVHWCLTDIGITLTDASDEVYAYFLQSLVKELK